MYSEGCLHPQHPSKGEFPLVHTHDFIAVIHSLTRSGHFCSLSTAMINVSALKSKLLCAIKTLKVCFKHRPPRPSPEIDLQTSVGSGLQKLWQRILPHHSDSASPCACTDLLVPIADTHALLPSLKRRGFHHYPTIHQLHISSGNKHRHQPKQRYF